jgi:hypothetical protein
LKKKIGARFQTINDVLRLKKNRSVPLKKYSFQKSPHYLRSQSKKKLNMSGISIKYTHKMNRFSPKSGSSYKFPKIEKVLYKDTLMKKLKHVNISLKGSTIQ